jgi:hypothetical protein
LGCVFPGWRWLEGLVCPTYQTYCDDLYLVTTTLRFNFFFLRSPEDEGFEILSPEDEGFEIRNARTKQVVELYAKVGVLSNCTVHTKGKKCSFL